MSDDTASDSPHDGDDEPSAADILDRLDDLESSLDSEEELEPMSPEEAREEWLDRLTDRADSTLRSYRDRTVHFIRFCKYHGITDLNDLTTRHIKNYESHRLSADLDKSSRKNEWGTLSRFLEYCEDLNAVKSDVPSALEVPSVGKKDRVNKKKLPVQRAEEILDNLDRFEHASREHVTMLLLWRTTIRLGALYGLDLDDLYLDDEDLDRLRRELEEVYTPTVAEKILDEAETPFIYPRHRPESGTPLKNQRDGERVINISEETATILKDYIEVRRHDVSDEHGRKPLLTSKKGDGRLSKSAIRNWCYVLTQPCAFGGECPHDRDPDTCDYRQHGRGSKCPSARSPHKVRTGSYTWHRDRGWPRRALEEKANTSLDDVYDQPTQLTRGLARRGHLDQLDEEGE